MLKPYRVIDLADDRGIFCGKILADLGAEVIKIEPTTGDPARRLGPFINNDPGIENSLYWQLYSANKKSFALDIHSPMGKEILLKLIPSCDILIESFAPGTLGKLGLGWDTLKSINSQLIQVSITPFGQTGPYKNHLATDIIGSALSGFAHLTGDSDRPPVRVSIPQFWLLGGATGATGAMIALQSRVRNKVGQLVDVSCLESLTRTLSHAPQFWDMNEVILKRSGPFRPVGEKNALRVNFECQDGYVNYIQPGGATGGRAMAALSTWMEEEGEGHPLLSSTDFGEYGFGQIPTDLLNIMNSTLELFFKTRSKIYLSEEAIKRRVLLFPVNNPSDIYTYPQLLARGFFREVTMQNSQKIFTLGPWIQSSDYAIPVNTAPSLGEHTDQILEELGLSRSEIQSLIDNRIAK